MACLLLALVLTATALTVKSEPCTAQDLSHTKVPTGDKLLFANAARTTPAEAFWRTAFPGAPMPEAIRELLHARTEATTVPNDVKLMDGGDDPPPMNFNYEDYSAAASRRNGAAAPSPRVLKLSASALNNAATDGNGKAGAMSSATAFFLEDAVRVGGSLPLPIVLRTATDAPTAGLAPPRLYTVRAVRTVEEGSSSIVVCRRRRGRKAGGPDHDAAVAYGCRATTTLSAPKRVYAVDVAGEDKDDGDAVVLAVAVVCHTDTSRWDTGHVALRLLGIKPGDAAVCHALPDAQVLAIENDEIIPVSP